VGIAALFVFVHNKYLKKKVKLPAYSEIFGPFQWVIVAIFGFLAVWTNFPNSSEIYLNLPFIGKISASFSGIYQMILLVLFTYFADSSHDIAEGIIDAKADLRFNVKTYSTTFGIKKAATISFFMFFVSAIFGIMFFIKSILSPVFIVLFSILFIYTMIYELRFLKTNNQKNNQYSNIAGRKLYNYFLFFYDLIFFGIMIQIIANYLLIN
jgi:4-hydroxybenzoate polyprenyltransferase